MIALSLPEPLVAGFLRGVVRPVLGPPFPIGFQRFWMGATSALNLPPLGVRRVSSSLGGVPTVSLAPTGVPMDGGPDRPVVLYLHGGAFITGSPRTHLGLAGYLARELHGPVHVIDYRLAPEHPYPAGREDAMAAYRALLAAGVPPRRIIVAGDSAGGSMAADLILDLKDAGDDQPAGAALLSPAVALDAERPTGAGRRDTLVRRDWAAMAMVAYDRPTDDPQHRIIDRDLTGLAPIHLQYGDEELLASECRSFAERLRTAGANPDVRAQAGAFHVLALLPGLMGRSRQAIRDVAHFAHRAVRDAPPARPETDPPARPETDPPARSEAYAPVRSEADPAVDRATDSTPAA